MFTMVKDTHDTYSFQSFKTLFKTVLTPSGPGPLTTRVIWVKGLLRFLVVMYVMYP